MKIKYIKQKKTPNITVKMIKMKITIKIKTENKKMDKIK